MMHVIFILFLVQLKKRGRRKGSKNKVSPEIEGMIGVANLHYAQGCYDKVKCLVNLLSSINCWISR
jgi:hypothetical protein